MGNCKFTFTSFHVFVRHLQDIKCQTDKHALLPQPDMVVEINDEQTKKLKFACAFMNCSDYGKTWSTKYGVYNHWQNVHIDAVEDFVQCRHCPKKLVSHVMLNLHMKESHSKLKDQKFSCSICGALRNAAWKLKLHEAIHQSNKPFSCDYCDYRTNTRGNRNAHVRSMHADKVGVQIRYHQCEFCGKKFKHTGNLRQHVESSHLDKAQPDPRYKCHICNKQLKQDNSYRKHMANVHGVGERCDICNKLSKTKDVLEKHVRAVHEN